MSIDKRECRKYADPGQTIPANNGLLYAEQVKCIVRTAIKNIGGRQLLVLYIYAREQAANRDFRPAFTVFQGKDDFVTLARCDDTLKWRTALFENLNRDYVFNKKCAFCSSRDEERVTRFCSAENKKGFDALCSVQSKIRAVQELRRRHEKQHKIIARMSVLNAVPRDLKGWLHREVLPQYLYFDYQKGKKLMSGYCTACKHDVQVSAPRHNAEGICPRCKKAITLKSRGKRGYIENRATVQIIQKVNADELVIRIFKVYSSYRKKDVPEQSVYETIRIFVRRNEAGAFEAEPYHTGYNNGDLTPWKTGYPPIRYLYQENFYAETCGHLYHRNLEKELMGTRWQYCQLKSFYLHDRKELETASYFQTYLNTPTLEYLVKLKLFWLAAHAVYGNRSYYGQREVLNMKGANIREVLGVEKSDIPFLQKNDVGIKELQLLQILRAAKQPPDEELFLWVRENEIKDIENFIFPLRHTTPHKLLRYLEEQYAVLKNMKSRFGGRRFGEMKDVLIEYKDYLRFCEELKYDLADSFLLFPRDLPRSHDQASDMRSLKKVEQYDRQIADLYKKLAGLYQYRKDGLIIIPPKSAQEIVAEGQKLHHCVGGYVSSVVKKECAILFVRREDRPDVPFFTVEVKGDQIVQARGEGNGAPPPQIEQFLKLWSKKKLPAKTAA